MTLPTFLCVGAVRAGTTWLHELLACHPDVYVPTRRKEICFFDQYYERGIQWYEKFFPDEVEAKRYRAIGEVSPLYLYCPQCPERIADVPSVSKLILTIRNPVDRSYSYYGLAVRLGLTSDPFETYLSLKSDAVQHGFYSQYLRNYLRFFDRNQFLVLLFEDMTIDVPRTKATLASFLGVPADRFPINAGIKRVHRSYIPKLRSAYALSTRVVRFLMTWDMDWVLNLFNRVGINRKLLFGEVGSLPPMREETRRYLKELYKEEITELESLLQINLDCWREISKADGDKLYLEEVT